MKHLLFALICIVCLASSHAAQAGSWAVDGYEYTMSSYSEYQTSTSGKTFRTAVPLTEKKYSPSSIGVSFPADFRLSSSYNGYSPFVYRPSRIYAHLTITPVFKWHRNSRDDPDKGLIPDPNDNPSAKVWYWENPVASASCNHALFQGHPQQPFNIGEVSNGMNSPIELVQPYADIFSKSANGSGVVILDSLGQETLHGHTRTLKVSASVGAVRSNLTDEGWYGHANVSYIAEMVVFTLQGRAKLAHDPTNMYEDLEFNPGNFDISNLAAGGLTTPDNVHQGDVIMGVKRNYGFPLGGVKRSLLPHLTISNKEGVKVRAKITNEKTTTDGNGRLLAGVLTSRDLTTTGWQDLMGISLSNTASSARVPFFTSNWANVEWKMGENGLKPWNPSFFVGSSDYKEWAWAKALFSTNLPLINHKIRFLVDYLEVQVTDSTTGQITTKIFTTDPTQAIQHVNEPAYQVVYQPDVTSLTSAYITPPDDAQSDAQGVVKGEFTVKSDKQFAVKTFRFALEDQGVYSK